MKKQSGISFGRRILSLMMVLLMAIPWVSAPAMAATNWNGLDIKVYWFDENNNQAYSNSASQVSWMKDYDAFWLSVPGNAPLSSLFLSISYPDHSDYTFSPGSDTSLGEVANAGDLTNASIPISVFDSNQNLVGSFNLYISTNPIPPEPEPTPTEALPVTVPIIYQGPDGAFYEDRESVNLLPGQNAPVSVDMSHADGYLLDDEATKTAEVRADGSFDPVIFNFKRPDKVNVPVIYQGPDGAFYEDRESVNLLPGQNAPVSVDMSHADGYLLDDEATKTAEVRADGSFDPVIFNFKRPDKVNVPVIYQGPDGAFYEDRESVNLLPGQNAPVSVDMSHADGYLLDDEATKTAEVRADGSFDPVIFNFKRPDKINVPVIYQGPDGAFYEDRESVNLLPGQNAPVSVDMSHADGYVLDDEATKTAEVRADGSFDPVIFNFKRPDKINVPVIYQGPDGAFYEDRESVNLLPGQNAPVSVDMSHADGYVLDDEATKTAEVRADGSFDPVIFNFKRPDKINVPVIYQGPDGNTLYEDRSSVNLLPGQNTPVSVVNENIPQGYMLDDEVTKTAEVRADGSFDPVIFRFKAIPAAIAKVTVQYIKDGVVFHTYDEDVAAPGKPYTADSSQTPAGYQLQGDATVNVTVNGDGIASPNPVTFTYIPTPAVQKSITIRYRNEDDTADVASPQQKNLAVGTHQIIPEPTDLQANYSIKGDTVKTVTVRQDGTADADSVTFIYAYVAAPVQKSITIRYRNEEDTADVASPQQKIFDVGTYQISPEPTDLQANYSIKGDTVKTVTVRQDGTADADSVTFIYAYVAAPVQKSITIRYRNEDDTADVASPQQKIFDVGTYQISPEPTDLQANYSIKGDTVKTVTVRQDGTADADSVTFIYAYVAAPVQKSITIRYRNEEDTADVASPQQKTFDVGTYQISPEPTDLQANYRIKGDTVKTVTIRQDGTADADTVTFIYELVTAPTPTPTAIPIGSPIDLWATTNSKVNFRSTPAIANNNVIKSLSKDTHVWMYESQLTAADEVWTRVRVDGQDGYIKTEFLEMMTKAQSDQYQASLPTPMPTRSPAPNVTATPVPSATPTSMPAQYQGYALTTKQVALRLEVSNSDQSILATLPQTTLVNVAGQVYSGTTPWSIVTTVTNVQGYVPDDALRRITPEEAKNYLDQLKTPTPTVSSQPTPTPNQQRGYAATLGDNVPMRGAANPNSSLVNMLAKNVVVYINSQEYLDGVAWHAVKFGEQWGYIRADQLRWLSQAETDAYLNSLKSPTPTPSSVTPPPVGPNSPSSYGYVSSKSVNFRSSPSTTSSNKISTLNEYAFALVLSTTQVDGKTWYKVNQGGKEGYIMGDYFHVLTLAELEDFLQSPEYTKGVTGGTNNNNNNNTGNNGGSSELPNTPEDWNVGTWTNPNSGLNATYEPFDPFATPEPLPTASPSPTPEPFETLPPPTDPPVETQSDSPSFLWLGLGITALAGFGGLYAYALHKSNQRKAAARAAQRRAAMQQQNAQTGARPYARATNAPMVPPTAGTQTKQAPPAGTPRPQAPGGAPSPYSQRPAQPPTGTGTGTGSGSGQYTSSTRPVQPGSTQMPRPSQQSNAYARPQQPGTPSSNRPEAQGIAGGQGNMTGQNGANSATSRQPRAGRHTGPDQNVPTDTNQDA